MPFAAMFGHNTMKNFEYCISSRTTSDMPRLMEPTKNEISSLGETGNELDSNIESDRKSTDVFRFNVAARFGYVYDLREFHLYRLPRTQLELMPSQCLVFAFL